MHLSLNDFCSDVVIDRQYENKTIGTASFFMLILCKLVLTMALVSKIYNLAFFVVNEYANMIVDCILIANCNKSLVPTVVISPNQLLIASWSTGSY